MPASGDFSESEASNHRPSLADLTTTTPELKFSVHTGLWRLIGSAASDCEFRGRWNDGVSRNDDYGMEKQ